MIRPVVLLCFFLSGFSGLLYEVLWLRMLILIFGSTTLAVSTVLTSFMGGLALGSYLFGRIMDRKKRPLLYYGLLEGVIGLYALMIPWLFTFLIPIYRVLWEHFHPNFLGFTMMQFLLVFLVLVIPTTCMGATLAYFEQMGCSTGKHLGGHHRPTLCPEHFRSGYRNGPERLFPASSSGGPKNPGDCRSRQSFGRHKHLPAYPALPDSPCFPKAFIFFKGRPRPTLNPPLYLLCRKGSSGRWS